MIIQLSLFIILVPFASFLHYTATFVDDFGNFLLIFLIMYFNLLIIWIYIVKCVYYFGHFRKFS